MLEREHEWRRDVKPQDLPHPSLEYGRDDAKLERLGPTFELEGENLALGGPVAGTPEPLRAPEVLSDLPRGSAEGWKLAAVPILDGSGQRSQSRRISSWRQASAYP